MHASCLCELCTYWANAIKQWICCLAAGQYPVIVKFTRRWFKANTALFGSESNSLPSVGLCLECADNWLTQLLSFTIMVFDRHGYPEQLFITKHSYSGWLSEGLKAFSYYSHTAPESIWLPKPGSVYQSDQLDSCAVWFLPAPRLEGFHAPFFFFHWTKMNFFFPGLILILLINSFSSRWVRIQILPALSAAFNEILCIQDN